MEALFGIQDHRERRPFSGILMLPASVAAEGPAWALNPSIDSARAVVLFLSCRSTYNSKLEFLKLASKPQNILKRKLSCFVSIAVVRNWFGRTSSCSVSMHIKLQNRLQKPVSNCSRRRLFLRSENWAYLIHKSKGSAVLFSKNWTINYKWSWAMVILVSARMWMWDHVLGTS